MSRWLELRAIFLRYVSVGVVNTALHWLIFLVLHKSAGWPQSWSNLGAFCAAASFSYCANALYTFKATMSGVRYALFVSFMGALSLGVGHLADVVGLPALVTLIGFSAISLLVGFVFSSLFIYRKGRT